MSRREYLRQYYQEHKVRIREQKQMLPSTEICEINNGHRCTQQEHEFYWSKTMKATPKKTRKLRPNESIANPWQSRPIYVPTEEVDSI